MMKSKEDSILRVLTSIAAIFLAFAYRYISNNYLYLFLITLSIGIMILGVIKNKSYSSIMKVILVIGFIVGFYMYFRNIFG